MSFPDGRMSKEADAALSQKVDLNCEGFESSKVCACAIVRHSLCLSVLLLGFFAMKRCRRLVS